jgi:hypothetical protein
VALKNIRLELARTKEFPAGNANCGYEFTAPLDGGGQFDAVAFKQHKGECHVVRFWQGANDERGSLIHVRGKRWVFSYAPGADDDEPIFKFDRHVFKPNEYVSITEHDGVTRPFKVVSVK